LTLIIVGLALVCCVLLYTTINQMLKVEKLEDQVEIRDRFINSIFTYVIDAKKEIDKLDDQGIIESDDQFGKIYGVFKKVTGNMYNFLSKYLVTDDGEDQATPKEKEG